MTEQLSMFWPSKATPGQAGVDATAQVELPSWMMGTGTHDQQRHARRGRHPTGRDLGPATLRCKDCRSCDVETVPMTKWVAEHRVWVDWEDPAYRCTRSTGGAPIEIQGHWRSCSLGGEPVDAVEPDEDTDPDVRAYRPSSGTEGMIFHERWCDRCCKLDAPDGTPCDILGRTLVLSVEDPEYPAEWVTGEHWPSQIEPGPRCTAFVAIREPKP